MGLVLLQLLLVNKNTYLEIALYKVYLINKFFLLKKEPSGSNHLKRNH